MNSYSLKLSIDEAKDVITRVEKRINTQPLYFADLCIIMMATKVIQGQIRGYEAEPIKIQYLNDEHPFQELSFFYDYKDKFKKENKNIYPALGELNQKLNERRKLRKENEKLNQFLIFILVLGLILIKFRFYKIFLNWNYGFNWYSHYDH